MKKSSFIGLFACVTIASYSLWMSSKDDALNGALHESNLPSEVLISARDSSSEQGFTQSRLDEQGEADPALQITVPTVRPVQYQMSAEEYAQVSRLGSLPKSVAIRTLPSLRLDGEGKLVVDENLKDLFEIFQSASEDGDSASSIEHLREYLTLVLPETEQKFALNMLDRYLVYKEALPSYNLSVDMYGQDDLPKVVKGMMDEKKALRREHLGTENAQAMFWREESYSDFAYERMVVSRDTELTIEEKRARVRTLAQSLPETSRKRILRNMKEEEIQDQIRILQNQDGAEEKIYALREQNYGKAVADRFVYLESETGEWQSKVSRFENEKANILASSEYTDKEKKALLTELQDTSFTKKEKFKLMYQRILKDVNSGRTSGQS